VRSKDPTGRPIFWFAVKPLYDESRGNESLACNYAVTTRSHCRKGSRSRAVGAGNSRRQHATTTQVQLRDNAGKPGDEGLAATDCLTKTHCPSSSPPRKSKPVQGQTDLHANSCRGQLRPNAIVPAILQRYLICAVEIVTSDRLFFGLCSRQNDLVSCRGHCHSSLGHRSLC